ncbi:MAG: methyltransferase domain-containing protein [Spirochaetia bacterium]|jgi:ubiquinone/menaquinone biosynthesis C-methylase UbiE
MAGNPDVDRFDQWAVSYDRSIGQRFFFVPVHTRMLNLLKKAYRGEPPRCIVDIGCGTGRLLRAAGACWPGARLHGFDPAPRMLEEARRHLAAATFTTALAESLPFPDQSADIALTSISFHHWADQGKGILEAARVLRSGGLFCLADHTFLPARLHGEKVRSRREVRELMRAAGLTVLFQRAALPFVTVTVARKQP